jgi:hypothetical protein
MQGASEFTVGGVLEYFNVTEQLPTIMNPTLVTSGVYDTMTLPVVSLIIFFSFFYFIKKQFDSCVVVAL